MKKIIFSGNVANDNSFVEIAICSYNYKMNGEKGYFYYLMILNVLEDGSVDFTKASVDELIDFVKYKNMTKDEIEIIIKNININPIEAIMAFGSEENTHLCQRLREIA